MKNIFIKCPSCKSDDIQTLELQSGGFQELCRTCLFVSNYVEFTCGCCQPDIFRICPNTNCTSPGTPKTKLCKSPT
mgnify:CR=1 FL=1|jgi:hypothetical protein